MIDEIRLHLSARRPDGQDDADPVIAAALAKAAAEPELAAWADAEKHSDSALSAKLRQIQPPPGLRDTILAGARVGRGGGLSGWFNRKAWRNFGNSELLAVAAIVLLLAVAVAWNHFSGTKPDANWQYFAATEVAQIENSEVSLDKFVSTMPQIHEYLKEKTCPLPGTLPASVRQFKILGCRTAMWRGEPMSIVCFAMSGGREIHLVTVSRRNLPASPPEGVPAFASINGYMTASWSEGDRAMMLIGKVNEADLQKLMGVAKSVGLHFPRLLTAAL